LTQGFGIFRSKEQTTNSGYTMHTEEGVSPNN